MKCHSLRQHDEWYALFCFSGRGVAEKFQLLFGGELIKTPMPH
jgi:hypothetical protein